MKSGAHPVRIDPMDQETVTYWNSINDILSEDSQEELELHAMDRE